MANWFTRLVDRVTPWDRGGELERRKKREEEEQQRRNAQALQQAPSPRASNPMAPNQPINIPGQPRPQQPVNIFENLNKDLVLGSTPIAPNVVKSQDYQAPIKQTPQEEELRALTDKYRQQALEEEKKRTSWFGRQFMDRNWDKRAEAQAINRATREYQEKHGWNRDPEVMKFQGGARTKIEESQKNSTSGWIAPVISTARVGTGIAEGAGGLFDILTPGKGSNRFTQGATRKAEEQDQLAKDLGIEKLYRTVNVPLEVASYLTPGVVSKGGKISQFLGKASTKVDDLLKVGSKFPKLRRVTSEAAQGFLDPQNLQKEIELTARYLGQDSAKGRAITPGVIAENAAQSVGGAFLAPLFKGLSRYVRRPKSENLIDEAIDAGISATGTGLSQADNIRRIPVSDNIPVDEVIEDATRVPVNVRTPETPLVQDIRGGATKVTPNSAIRQAAADTKGRAAREGFEASVAASRPDPRLTGITPPDTGNTGLFTRAEIDAEYQALDDALVNKEINKAQHKAAKEELDTLTAFDDAPKGTPITVKQVNGIDVIDNTVVPTDLPETPGTVRVTGSTAPSNTKSAAAAAQPVVSLPKEIQAVLDNPKQFNKRQVASARNQVKLAKQYAKTQEQTADAMSRIEATKPPTTTQPEGYAPTGKFDRGRRGVYQKTSAAAEAVAGEAEMANRSVDNLLDEIGGKESFTPGDRRRIAAALENVVRANPEDRETRMILKKLQSKSRTELAQGLAMWPRVVRKSASADTLVNRWESKIARALEDPTKMTDADFARVQTANDSFTLARDKAAQLEEQFRRTGSEADFTAWEEAHRAARQADTDAKFIEADVARRVLKGEKGAVVNKVLDDLKREADVNTMDTITASMLSGTGTGFRNTLGTELAGVENRLFANTRAKVTNKLFDTNVGGFDRKSARLGRKVGIVKLGKDARRRAEIGGKNPIEWAKNWSTTINSGGESSLQSQVYSRLGKYYKNQFAEQGLKGKELDMRMRHALLTDPDGLGDTFLDAAMKSSGLTGIFQKGQSIEKAVTDYVGRQTDNKTAQAASKLIMRLAVGFPTATANFIAQSGKRLAVGLPSFMETGFKMANGDKAGAALAFDRGLKEAGSGMAMLGFGAALGSQGIISGPYPSDLEERARWEREGISENSIKIGDAWYPIPQGAGMLGLPVMLGAAFGREGDSNESVAELLSPKNLAELLPTDQLQGFLNMASGNGAPQDLKNTIASGVRAATPAGSLFNQLSKLFDETKNDTTTKDFWSNVFDQVMGGIPGVNNAANIPDKTDDAGNPISNPNPVQLAFGATSATQGAGEERSAQIAGEVDSTVQGLVDLGIVQDANLQQILDDDEKLIYNQLANGKTVSPDDIKKLREAYVKGVSITGDDTAYLEREQYDTNLAVLRLKKKLMEEDKTVKPSDLKKLEVAIKRGEIYKDGQIPYDLISDYQGTGVEEWRDMGDPEDDNYDPDMYEKLWQIDQALTKAGVSYKRGSLEKNKYYVKAAGKGRGRGGGGSRSIDTSFGTLGDFSFAPRVQQYAGIDAASGQIPYIRTVRPNIVHKISSSG
jgi:hypothetical protein